jgi:RiboL-PSP-HEPN
MTQSFQSYNKAIDEINDLLYCFDDINKHKPNQAPRVMKRAALIMILTAWETYVEDVVEERLDEQLKLLKGSHICHYVHKNLKETYKGFNNPNSNNTKHLFEDFLGIDVTDNWKWNNVDQEAARTQLNAWIKRRGDAVHRIAVDNNSPDIVKRDELNKCLFFFAELVKATEAALELA